MAWASMALGLLGAGCGASYQAIYEGEVRFEHCHRLDEEPGIPLTQRRECWREWTKFYTYGQTRDRLEYALRRQRELTAKIENPNANDASSTPSDTAEPLAAPPPTSPFVPPPHVHSDGEPPAQKPVDPAELIELFSASESPKAQPCLIRCMMSWHSCGDTCDPKDDAECRNGCDAAFKGCVKACVER